jgi:hypothetical protein
LTSPTLVFFPCGRVGTSSRCSSFGAHVLMHAPLLSPRAPCQPQKILRAGPLGHC